MKTLPKERRYETLSYLPPLTDQQIVSQIQYMFDQGFIPAVEFEENPLPTDHHWTMWKLPLFSASTPQDVLSEVRECRSEYSNCYIRVVGFDNIKQCQTVSFIVYKPGQGIGRY
ncbi:MULTISPECIES: ribulose bisphosphate carboxylase small subunit [Cyanophyceae]|uniref:ribulose bisphosphate carboxylase small subunit n=1 Tax=Cyanophyceae TaxID=3028117 RepID=UPI00135A3D6F|nr:MULTISPECIES: ribulose bisphosphate carboxylase small subunit [Cyanophyceae]MCC5900009.1 ribulose bisphosphate carboxylase small subunit [Phormidium sp. BM_Day4_Bin.17]NMG60392.1 ribulose bisphosphate carboxylase small subunit [Geitlerinema sp. P-1104]TVR12332.1 MAG: ribulose bisphosphate carboxylase small subunit [Phormidium sp. GEM2.Bin31]UCJ13386.1 MAG: ribulose bisphosphate carboxylase small subunit [Phormidium sp. PBR-2020]